MSSRHLTLPAGMSGYAIAGVAAALVVVAIKLSQPSKLDAIPTVGSSSWLGSWWGTLNSLINGVNLIQEGYEKYKSAPFKIAEYYGWAVVVSSREHIEELRRAPDDTLSFADAVNDQLRLEYTIGHDIHRNPYHISIVRSQLTRNIGTLYSEIRNEIVTALDDVLDLRDNEWKSVQALRSVEKVVCRASNRVLVGLPLCRELDWIDLTTHYTLELVKSGIIVWLFPDTLKSTVARWIPGLRKSYQRGRELLGPIIEERQKYINEYGNEWADKPNDFLSWMMEEAQGPELSIERLTGRILFMNFAAIHTTSNSFTHALLFLAANPQYIQPLREEVEAIVEKEGWSKAALSKMQKVDSFLRECQRIEGIQAISMPRKALKDFTFSDGTFIPKGTMLCAAARCVHLEEANYKNAHVFEPFRFVDLHEEDGEGGKFHFTSATTEYLPFGYGRHACPGRFFAANALKTMLAHIVVTYDIKLTEGATRPKPLHIGTSLAPNPKAKVMFRARVD